MERAQDNSIIQQDKRETSVPVQNGLLLNDTSEYFHRNIIVRIKICCLFKAKNAQGFFSPLTENCCRYAEMFSKNFTQLWKLRLPPSNQKFNISQDFFYLNYKYQF